jgi:hypothetical protein
MSRDRLTYAQLLVLVPRDRYAIIPSPMVRLAGWWRHIKNHGIWTPVAGTNIVGNAGSCVVDANGIWTPVAGTDIVGNAGSCVVDADGRRWKVWGLGCEYLLLRRAWGLEIRIGYLPGSGNDAQKEDIATETAH